MTLAFVLPSLYKYKVGTPFSSFRSSVSQPTFASVYASRWPHGFPGKTRGQVGSLLLSCRTLSFPAVCRFIPALTYLSNLST